MLGHLLSLYHPILFNTKTDSLFMTTSRTSFNTFHCNLSPKSCNKQQLIVEINIGKTGAQKFIWLSDIHDANNIDEEIKSFIHNNGLKEAAFGYIKDIICKRICHHQQQLCFQCPSIASRNCGCSKKAPISDHHKKQFIDATFSNGLSSKSLISGLQQTLKKQGPQLTTKITPKIDSKASNTRHEDASSFVFNSQFTLPSSVGQKELFFLTDQLYQNVLESSQTGSSAYFSSMSQFRSKERGKENKIIIKINDISMKRPTGMIPKSKQSTFNKNSLLHMKTAIKIKTNTLIEQNSKHATPLRIKSNNRLSTKQRKSALMIPQKSKACDAIPPNLIHLNSDKLQSMVLEHKKILKEAVEKQLQTVHLQTSFPHKGLITSMLDATLYLLFQKLTAHNPPQMPQIHSQYVFYQLLSRQQLHFMGLLFQRIDHKQLNHLNYPNFRANSIKHCWMQLQDLISSRSQSKRTSL